MSLLFRNVQDLGPVIIDSFHNQSNLKLQSYVWPQVKDNKPKGIVIAIHGITSHVKFEFLNHYEPSIVPPARSKSPKQATKSYPRHFTYEGSWAETFNQNGFIFSAYDQQGHGCSEAWMASRCNVESFDHFAFDALQFAIRMNRLYNKGNLNQEAVNFTNDLDTPLPIFILGISMGGGVVLRTLSLCSYILRNELVPPYVSDEPFMSNQHKKNNNGSSNDQNNDRRSVDLVSVELVQRLPPICGISMCPNLSLKALTKKALNRVLLPLSRPMSFLLPYARLGTLVPNTRYPWIEEDRLADAQDVSSGMFNFKLPARIAYQNVILGPRVFQDLPLLADEDSDSNSKSNGNSENASEEKNSQQSKDDATNESDARDTNKSGGSTSSRDRCCQLSLVVIHSKNDTMTDCSGSVELYSKLETSMRDVELWLLDDMWHYLTLEDGNQNLRMRIIDWMAQRSERNNNSNASLTHRSNSTSNAILTHRSNSGNSGHSVEGDSHHQSRDDGVTSAPPSSKL